MMVQKHNIVNSETELYLPFNLFAVWNCNDYFYMLSNKLFFMDLSVFAPNVVIINVALTPDNGIVVKTSEHPSFFFPLKIK